MTGFAIKPGIDHDADAFLRMLGDQLTFQTFDESGMRRADLSCLLHGTLADHADTLTALNQRGAGVFVMVNAGDGMGRKTENVNAVRALFVDLDGAPLEPVKAAPLAPHCIVETSPGRWHAYWAVADCPLCDFKPLQKALAAQFNADASVCDLPRVMRVPGFDHRKSTPFRSRIVAIRTGSPYSVGEFRAGFGFGATPAPTRTPRTLLQRIPEGERNDTLFSLARGLVQRGFDAAGVKGRLQRINAERCEPPLPVAEVDAIAANASAYGPDGFSTLTYKLFDSPELNDLPLPSRWIILTALRRYNGSNNGNIALTHADCCTIPGCVDEGSFIHYRKLAVHSGLLILAEQGRMTRDGKTPHLYAIAPAYLHSHTRQITQLADTRQITQSYIDKQSLGSCLSAVSDTPAKTGKTA
jgi:hypothetical protein